MVATWKLPEAFADERALAARFRAAAPFPHLVVDDVVDAERLPGLLAEVDEEPLSPRAADLYAFEATDPSPRSESMRALRAGFAAVFAAPLARITGREIARVDMRAYVYGPGHYLLPHTDHQEAVGRALAWILYLPTPAPPVGGELELFACELEGREIAASRSALVIAPRPNRLVVFEVGDASLHQVREVLAGSRISLAGWFYP